MSTARSITAALAGLGLALSLSACSSSDDTAETSAQYCTSSAAAQAEVAELKTLVGGGEATIDDVKAQVESIGTATATAAEDAADEAEDAAEDASDQAEDAAEDAADGSGGLERLAGNVASGVVRARLGGRSGGAARRRVVGRPASKRGVVSCESCP